MVGASSSGKTQLCMLAATVTAACCPASVLYIDTSQSFSAERVAEMHRRLPLPTRPLDGAAPLSLPAALDKIRLQRVYTVHALLALLHSLHASLSALSCPSSQSLRLVVVDSVASLLSPILGGKQHRGHALLAHVSLALHALAASFHLAVLITNHTVSARGERRRDAGAVVGALGESCTYVADTRLDLDVVSGQGLGIGVGEGTNDDLLSAKTVRKIVRATLSKSSNGECGRACLCIINSRGLTAHRDTA